MSATAAATATVAGVDVPTDHYINGERVASDRTFTTISPIDQSVLAEVARARRTRGRPRGARRA